MQNDQKFNVENEIMTRRHILNNVVMNQPPAKDK